jgi:hypothetical protein
MSFNNTSLAPFFINYDVDTEDSQSAIEYSFSALDAGEEFTASTDKFKKFKSFRIQAGDADGKMWNIDMDLKDLETISKAADRDIEIKFRTLKVCQGGREANIVVLCSQAFTNQD